MATELDRLFEGLCEREERNGCYDVKVDGISVYLFIRFQVRNYYISSKGYNFVEKLTGLNRWHYVRSVFLSAYHLFKILILHRKFDTLFYPFLRLDNVSGEYLDKFTDPVIDCCNITNGYLIFERGRRGEHPSPRIHKDKVVYSNFIDFCCDIYARLMYKRFEKRHKIEFDLLFDKVNSVIEGVDYDKYFLINRIAYNVLSVRIYEKLFKKLGVKKILGPSRANLLGLICAARHCGIKVYEFQHGITYGGTAIYSGRRLEEFTPDGFLSFGELASKDVYGIDSDKAFNIGWAFQDYLKKRIKSENRNGNDVLVISGPCLTDKIFSATFQLAQQFPSLSFAVRPHPVEVITENHLKQISKYDNVSLQSPKINVAEAMQPFDNVIGENSTVLYEALNYGKKVARFCYEGFAPRYLTPEDEECFWKVNDMASFKAFIEGKPEDKKSMKIYSKFDKELFMKIYNS